MFWLWFAANSSIVSIGFGATLFSLGMSLRQAIVSALIGVALSCLPLGLGTLAGKRSGQPTVIVSRAAFGVVGNVVPAILALASRVFWGAVLLWLAATSTAFILIGAELGGPLSYDQLVIVGLAVGFALALIVAFFGYSLLAKFQLVVSVLAAVLIVGLIVMTWPFVDFATALTVGDGNWILLVSGAVLVFSFIGLVWANSSADLSRYQRPGSSGAGSMLWASFGTTVPTFVLIAYGAILAASHPDLAAGLVERPLDVLAGMLPLWYPIPLILVTVLSLISGIVISVYSAGFALQGVGVRLSRQWTTLIAGLLLFFVAWVLSILDIDLSMLFRDIATTLAVPVAAWVGIFAADTMIRRRRYHSASLLSTGGVYPTIHWVNVPMFVVISAIGFAFTTATVSWLTWQGYGFGLLAIDLTSELAASDLGVLVALVLGLLTPVVAGIPSIRKQEATELLANES
jgi:purine-cytosine permease-like protein